jgi:MFS family permease
MTPAEVNWRTLLGIRGFRLLLTTRLVGQFGDGLLQASLATYVLFSPERQPSAVKVAVAFSILLLPYSFIGPFAGVFIDRWSRQRILVFANLTRSLLVVGLAVIVATGRQDAMLAVAVLVVLGVNRFILASLSASLPHVVQGRELVTANAIAPTAGTMASVLGGLTGVLLNDAVGGGTRGSVCVLAGCLIIYVLAATIASRVQRQELGPDDATTSETFRGVAAGMADGLRHLRARRPAARAIGLVMIHRVVFGIALALTVLQARGTLHPSDPTAALGAVTLATGAAGAGAFVGAVSTPSMSRRLGTVRWAALALVAGVGPAALIISIGTLPTLLMSAALVGFAGQAVKVCSDTIVQADTDDSKRGRVFALYDVAVNVSIVVGLTLCAFIAPSTGRSAVMSAAMGICGIIGASWALWAQQRDPASRYAIDAAAISSESGGDRVA